MTDEFARQGWAVLPFRRDTADWAAAARTAACDVTGDPDARAKWLRHGATWFVGVDALPNAPDGAIGATPLRGGWDGLIALPPALHRAQLSVIYPGYPQQDPGDTDAAHRFRRDRDAAHLDGLLAEGPDKRRYLREPHAWILGLPLNVSDASPLVVWDGSHEIIRAAFQQAFAGIAPADWRNTDVTRAYQAARKDVLDRCARRVVQAAPGQAVILHRLTIHGVAPWAPAATAPPEGRMIAYFRPLLRDPADWLRLP
jgi:hypothetical protein